MRRENGSATESSEDYLEVIFVIRQESGRCRNVDIAERMGVTKPSVTKALARLSAQSLVKVVGRDVRLTQKGLGVVRATLDKHEFFKRLLCDAGVDARLAAREACRMEHCLSEDSFQRLAAYLGNRQDEGDSR